MTESTKHAPQTSHLSPADARLLKAASEGNLDALMRALSDGAQANTSDDQDISALRWAARGGHHIAVKALLDAWADVNQRSVSGWTALMEAITAGSEQSVSLLLDAQAKVDLSTAAGASTLSLAEYMVEHSPDPERARRISRRVAEMTVLEEFAHKADSSVSEGNEEDKESLPRYKAMALLVDASPLAPQAFATIVEQHREFIASGGGGGRWLTLVTEDDPETGLIMGLYEGEQNKEAKGTQANLEHKRLDGLDLRGVQLPYASLLGVSARAQNLQGANLAGILATDSDFRGANFEGANLSGADFSRSELSGCNFRGANLADTDFENADLSAADLSEANTIGTSFIGALLS